ncbi:MAG: regulatory protein RecX [Bacillota bacterium]|nr:regulatory protein RecX [Bacillota bacterium]
MVITSVERNNRIKNSLMVYVDDKFSFSIDEEDYLTMNLYEMKDITEEQINHIKYEYNYKKAKSKAVGFLSLRLRSEKEVLVKLKNEGFSDETSYKVIEELKSLGYLNDKLYAQKYIYDRCKLKPESRKLLIIELQKKGISNDIINEVAEDIEIDDYTVAEGLVRKKFGKYDLRDEKIVRRVYSFLHHRGYEFEFIGDLLEKINNK